MSIGRPSDAQTKLLREKVRTTSVMGAVRYLKQKEQDRQNRAKLYLVCLTEIHARKHPQ